MHLKRRLRVSGILSIVFERLNYLITFLFGTSLTHTSPPHHYRSHIAIFLYPCCAPRERLRTVLVYGVFRAACLVRIEPVGEPVSSDSPLTAVYRGYYVHVER